MMLEAQTFDYVVKDQDGEILGKYSSTDELPMKGEMIDLSSLPHSVSYTHLTLPTIYSV